MTKLMEKALDAVRLGPGPYQASPEELAAIDEALEQVERGERASPAGVEAAFARFRK